VVVDAAGNLGVIDRRANGSKMTVRTPLLDETMISANLSIGRSGGRDRVLADYGRSALLEGRLTGVESGGIGSTHLTVTEIPLPGSRWGVRRRVIQTDGQGRFEAWLKPGPGRKVIVRFAGTRRLKEATSGVLELRVRGKLNFKAGPKRLRTGSRVDFRGRVLGREAWNPPRGNLVQIQYFEESARKWRPVKITRTDRNGRYRTGYRFRYITGTARIRLRALLIPSLRFPYSGAASKPVIVRVRG
jgi:hypothetical protein